MNGFQTTQVIRQREAVYNDKIRVPIVAISADAGIPLAECLAKGMDGLCNLGATTSFQDVLLTVVRHWLQAYRKSPRKTPPDMEGMQQQTLCSLLTFCIAGEPSSKDVHAQTTSQLPKILIVEDNNINMQVVKKFLEKSGYTNYDIANDGKEAVELYSTIHYDLILMDCQVCYPFAIVSYFINVLICCRCL